MRSISVRKLSVSAVLAGTTLAGCFLTASPAHAGDHGYGGGRTVNRAALTLTGGNARALAACVNLARESAKYGKPVVLQSNRCGGATAIGGDVALDDVDVEITQVGDGGHGDYDDGYGRGRFGHDDDYGRGFGKDHDGYGRRGFGKDHDDDYGRGRDQFRGDYGGYGRGRRGGETTNDAKVTLRGGDATAIAACLNYASGKGTILQRNQCAGARAQGGDVKLEDSDITIVQA